MSGRPGGSGGLRPDGKRSAELLAIALWVWLMAGLFFFFLGGGSIAVETLKPGGI